ncbi:unnamed protein product [Orchesella dallaii]|uniref:Uncharacterized protein n=1 Tax=Orchesella dallaii TaxID=48710 RepID=A0ABP1QRJ8_9HEXA
MGRLLISVCCIILLYQQLATCIPAPQEAEIAPAAAAEKAPAAAAEEKAPAATDAGNPTNATGPDGRGLLGIDLSILDFSKNKKSKAGQHQPRPQYRRRGDYDDSGEDWAKRIFSDDD